MLCGVLEFGSCPLALFQPGNSSRLNPDIKFTSLGQNSVQGDDSVSCTMNVFGLKKDFAK